MRPDSLWLSSIATCGNSSPAHGPRTLISLQPALDDAVCFPRATQHVPEISVIMLLMMLACGLGVGRHQWGLQIDMGTQKYSDG